MLQYQNIPFIEIIMFPAKINNTSFYTRQSNQVTKRKYENDTIDLSNKRQKHNTTKSDFIAFCKNELSNPENFIAFNECFEDYNFSFKTINIDVKSPVEQPDFYESAIKMIAFYGNKEMLEYIADKMQININTYRNKYGNTLLITALISSRENNTELPRYLIEEFPSLLNIPNNKGTKPIDVSARCCEEMFKYIVNKMQLDIATYRNESGDTLLRDVLTSSKKKLAKYIIEEFPDLLQIFDSGGNLPIDIAAYSIFLLKLLRITLLNRTLIFSSISFLLCPNMFNWI